VINLGTTILDDLNALGFKTCRHIGMRDPQLHPKTQRREVQGILQEAGHSITPLKQINHINADRYTL
jgi:hypothetical protein